jgi:hypothetical protein
MPWKTINSSIELLLPVSSDGVFSDQMAMLPTDKPVLIVSGPFSQHDVDQYTWCFRSPHVGSWVCEDVASDAAATKGDIVSVDERLDIPQVRLGPGLSKDLPRRKKTRYVLVIQGRTGAHTVKVMVADSREQAATIMMHEALNGYSTVFSTSYDGPALQDLPIDEKLRFRAFSGSDWLGYEEGVTVVNMVCHPPLKHDEWKELF